MMLPTTKQALPLAVFAKKQLPGMNFLVLEPSKLPGIVSNWCFDFTPLPRQNISQTNKFLIEDQNLLQSRNYDNVENYTQLVGSVVAVAQW